MTETVKGQLKELVERYNNLNRAFRKMAECQDVTEKNVDKLVTKVKEQSQRIKALETENASLKEVSNEEMKTIKEERDKITEEVATIDIKLKKLSCEYTSVLEFVNEKKSSDLLLNNEVKQLQADFVNLKEKGDKKALENHESHEYKKVEKENESVDFICNQCNIKFTARSNLKYHIKMRHPKIMKCNMCHESFDENWKLEIHMKSHGKQKQFKCSQCEHEFFLEWRLKKHEMMHMESNSRKCHYFNNGKNCPFSDIGCKFLHEHSDPCKLKFDCRTDKCQFRH